MKCVVGGTEWEILFVDDKFDKELKGAEGICQPRTHRILINKKWAPEGRVTSILFHELFHASGDLSNARFALQQYLNVTPERMLDIEEMINRTYGQAIFDTLQRNGWLSLPCRVEGERGDLSPPRTDE